ncbi:unnamed protein product [Dibothriocephalus latus]|uniref:Uncharacterized protein n=1 Tax=Dibothriocephalus latus TaxID=60516 RepID=A0A3P7MXG7_DIBLA|nr:unnamed protein product [Dibothriocephalus latus]
MALSISKFKVARRLDPNSQLATQIGETGCNFDIQGTTIAGQGATKSERLTLEAWQSGAKSVNRHLDLPAAYKVLRHYVSKGQDTVKPESGFADEDGSGTKPPEEGAGLPISSTVGTKQKTNCRHTKPKSTHVAKQRPEKNRSIQGQHTQLQL